MIPYILDPESYSARPEGAHTRRMSYEQKRKWMMWASWLSWRMTCITLMRCHSVHDEPVPARGHIVSATPYRENYLGMHGHLLAISGNQQTICYSFPHRRAAQPGQH